MIIKIYKKFSKAYRKQDIKLQEKIDETLLLFRKNPFDRKIRNHPLKGDLHGRRAIKVTGDIRIVFQEFDNYMLVLVLDVGSHNQVY